jgi:hypothetical protein
MRNTKQNFKGAIHPSPEVLGFLASMDKFYHALFFSHTAAEGGGM